MSAAPSSAAGELRLATLPGDHRSFASLAAIVEQIRPLANEDQRVALDKLERYRAEAAPPSDAGVGGHGQLMTDAVAFSILRRISRESAYTARLIDHGARTINAILAQAPSVERVVVDEPEQLDRPSLKVLARAVLLARPEQRLVWIWRLASVPSVPEDTSADLLAASRAGLFAQFATMLAPSITGTVQGGSALARIGPAPSTYELSAALVVQNYDFCFLWGPHAPEAPDTIGPLRLCALAAVNTGEFDGALELLARAEARCETPGLRGHLCYLQGLIEAKRSYDLEASERHYRRGLQALESTAGSGEDPELERAWLLNGIALNEAIRWRREPRRMERHREAFRLVNEAFRLVQEGTEPARIYLRFNLVANSAFLLEMQQRYELAIEVLSRAFDFAPGSPTASPGGQVALGYRIGVLHHRMGQHRKARDLIAEACTVDRAPENWPTHDRLLRALGTICLAAGLPEEAEQHFAEGLAIAQEARSAEGTAVHARGVAESLRALGRQREAAAYEELAQDLLTLAPLAPKLPPYFPELDLEETPRVDLNRYLGAALADDRPLA